MSRAALLLVALIALTLPIPSARAAPGLSILSPTDGALIGDGAPVVLSFTASDFTFVQPGRVGQVPGPGSGYAEVRVDGRLERIVTAIEPIVLLLESGAHTLTIELRASDGSALAPPVRESVEVTVTRGPATGSPAVRILFPPAELRTGHDVYVGVAVSNFTLVDPRGQPNAPNEGHLEFAIDGAYHQELASYAPGFLVDLEDGWNTLMVRLVNNDGTPLSPDVTASTRVYIKPSSGASTQLFYAAVAAGLVVLLAVAVHRRLRGTAPRSPPEEPSR